MDLFHKGLEDGSMGLQAYVDALKSEKILPIHPHSFVDYILHIEH